VDNRFGLAFYGAERSFLRMIFEVLSFPPFFLRFAAFAYVVRTNPKSIHMNCGLKRDARWRRRGAPGILECCDESCILVLIILKVIYTR